MQIIRFILRVSSKRVPMSRYDLLAHGDGIMKSGFLLHEGVLASLLCLMVTSSTAFAQDDLTRDARLQMQQQERELKQLQSAMRTMQPRLLHVGKALSRGSTLCASHLGADLNQVDAVQLQNHAAGKVRDTAGNLALRTALSGAGRAGAKLGGVLTVAGVAKDMWDVYQVGSGKASPESIRHIVPHVVMAWDALKGPRNLPRMDFHTNIDLRHLEPGFSIRTTGYIKGTRFFSSTAPPEISAFGWDPMTDSITTIVRTHMETHTKINGRDWNRHIREMNGLPHSSPSNVLVRTVYSKYADSDICRSSRVHYSSPIVPTYNNQGVGRHQWTPPQWHNPRPYSPAVLPPPVSQSKWRWTPKGILPPPPVMPIYRPTPIRIPPPPPLPPPPPPTYRN